MAGQSEFDGTNGGGGPSDSKLGTWLRLARAALIWERLWPALWPAMGIAGTFVALALADVLRALPGWLHLLALFGFAGLLGWAFVRAVRAFRAPDLHDARRRLEQASGLTHRPLTVVNDALAAGRGDPAARALWAAHQRRMAEVIRRLKIGVPSPGLARRDPWGLRAALVIALVIGAAAAWPDPLTRLARAVTPDFSGSAGSEPARLDLWITPPVYTGLAPLFPKQGSAVTVIAPMGSILMAQVKGGRGTPALIVGEKETPFTPMDRENAKVEATLEEGGRLAVVQGAKALADWRLAVVIDLPPIVAFSDQPQPTPRAALRISFSAEDDYGVDSADAKVRRIGEDGEIVNGKPLSLELPLAGKGVRKAEETSYHDLTPHPWAGFKVRIRLIAKDAIDQTGESEPMEVTLPERNFRHPVARDIIVERKKLTAAPDDRKSVMSGLMEIASRPWRFADDTVVFLSLSAARSRLVHQPGEKAITSTQALLWDTALRLEDGRLSIAMRDLRRAQEALMRALAQNAPDKELERLMREVDRALDRYLQAMAQELRKIPPEALALLPFDPRMRMVEGHDLRRMLEEARRLMRSGARQAARDILRRLQAMLENMRSGRMAGRPNQGSRKASEIMRRLQELIQRQRRLLDQTFRRSRQGQSQPGQRQGSGQGAGEQRTLQQMLQALKKMLQGMGGGDLRALDWANRAMGRATGALERNQPGQAVGPQTEALDQLQQAGRSMIQQMMRRMGRQFGLRPGMRFNPSTPRRDPLGQPLPPEIGEIDTNDVQIPDEADLQRAHRIMQELRRRANQGYRPIPEHEYIERLLKRF